MKKVSKKTLAELGFKETSSSVDGHRVWENASEKIVYDSKAEVIIERTPREFKTQTVAGSHRGLAVGERQYND